MFVPNGTHVTKAKVVRLEQIRLLGKIGKNKMRKMKDSGIEWIGEIPEDWEVLPFRHVLQERNERNNPVVSEERLSLSIERGVTLYADKTTNLDRFKDDFAQYKLAYMGDLVMNSMNMIVGATGVSKWFGCVSPVYYTFYDNDIEHTTAKFCEYIFRSKTMLRVLHSFGKGIYSIDRGDDKINTCRLKVAKSDLKNIKIPIPQISEQKLIIQFLDKKCSEIDSVISKTRETIEEYKKLKQSIITEVVTGKVKFENGKVCGKYNTYKDSGVEWIGEIPSEWSVCQIKRFAKLYNGKEIENEVIKSDYAIDVYGSGGVFKYTTNYLYDGEAVLFGRKGSIGKPLIVDGKFWTVDTMYFSTCKQELAMNKFLFYLLKIFPWDVYTTKTALPSIVGSEIFNSFVPVPPLTSQLSLITFLDKKCSEIDKLITKKEQLVVELESYKKSLIYEVVTGKRGV